MIGRLIAKLTTLQGDPATNSVYNATVVSGGTAVNVIPAEARATINMRSSDTAVLARMRRQALEFVREARAEELAWATRDGRLDVRYTALTRPGGQTPADHPLVRATVAAFEAQRLPTVFAVKSTDANLPMSIGIPAVTISSGGKAGNAHALDEWHDVTGRTKELAALGDIVFAAVG